MASRNPFENLGKPQRPMHGRPSRGRPSRPAPRPASRPSSAPPMRTVVKVDPKSQIVANLANAYGLASAQIEAESANRPNRVGALQQPDPTADVIAGATITTTYTLKEGRYVLAFQATAEDIANFVCTSLVVNGYNVDDGVPFPLCVFDTQNVRIERVTPLTGRMWNSEVTVTASFRNISGATKKFRGIAITQIDSECRPSAKKTRPAPGFRAWKRMAPKLAQLKTFFSQ